MSKVRLPGYLFQLQVTFAFLRAEQVGRRDAWT
jgi:hypothetical protein